MCFLVLSINSRIVYLQKRYVYRTPLSALKGIQRFTYVPEKACALFLSSSYSSRFDHTSCIPQVGCSTSRSRQERSRAIDKHGVTGQVTRNGRPLRTARI